MISILHKAGPRCIKPFKSPAAAQRWYEWRMFRPIFLLNLVYSLLFVIAWVIATPEDNERLSSPIIPLLVFCPVLTGVYYIVNDFIKWRSGAYGFISVRPVHASTLAYAHIRPIISQWLLITIITATLATVLHVQERTRCIENGSFMLSYSYWAGIDEPVISVLLVSFFCFVSFFWASRRNFAYLAIASIPPCIYIYIKYVTFQEYRSGRWLQDWAEAMSFVVIAGMVYSYLIAWRKKALNGEILLILFGLWLFFGSIPFLVYNKILPPYCYYEMLLGGLALLSFIFEPLVSMQLMFHRKRSGSRNLITLTSFPVCAPKIWLYRLALLLAAIIILSGLASFRGYAALWYHQELAALQKNQLLQPEYLKAIYPEVAPEENASLIHQKAFALAEEARKKNNERRFSAPSYELLRNLRDPLSCIGDRNYLDKLKQELQGYGEVFDLFDLAATMSRSRYFEDLLQKPRDLYLTFSEIEGSNTLLLARAIVAVDEGNSTTAIKALRASFALYRAYAQEPVFSWDGMLRTLSNDNFAALGYILSHLQLNDEELEGLQEIIADAMHSKGILNSISVEFNWKWAEFNTAFPVTQNPKSWSRDQTIPLGAWYRWSGLYDFERALFLRNTNWLCQRISWEYPETFDNEALSDIGKISVWEPRSWWTRVRAGIVGIVYFGRARDAYALALQRMACAALAIERHRLEYGQPPDSLWDLDERYLCCSLQDPYGKTNVDAGEQTWPHEKETITAMEPLLKYRRFHTGYVLYSVGANRKDDSSRTFFKFNGYEHHSDDRCLFVKCPDVEFYDEYVIEWNNLPRTTRRSARR